MVKKLCSSLNSLNALEKFSGVFNAKLEGEDILKPTARIESLHKEVEDGVGRSNYQFIYLCIHS
jgi:hypothetical protein